MKTSANNPSTQSQCNCVDQLAPDEKLKRYEHVAKNKKVSFMSYSLKGKCLSV